MEQTLPTTPPVSLKHFDPIENGTSGERAPGHVYVYRYLILDRHGQQRWRGNFKIAECRWNGSGKPEVLSLRSQLKWDLLIVHGLAGELDLQVGVDGTGLDFRFRQLRADGDHGVLGAASDLHHVQVAVAVSGFEGLDWYGDQEFALARAAEPFPTSRMRDALALVERVRDVIRESRFLEYPDAVRRG